MQAHASDLRAEVANDWDTLVDSSATPLPDSDGLDDFVHDAVDDWRRCGLNPAMTFLLEHAEKISRTPAHCTAEDLELLREIGWSDRALHDAVQVVSYFNYINRVADALGVDPEPDQPRWGGRAGS